MSNIRSLFLVCHVVDDRSGIGKKVRAQLDSLRRNDFDVTISHLAVDGNNKYTKRMIEDEVLEEYIDFFALKKRWKWRISFGRVVQYIVSKKIEFVYIRYTHFANPSFIHFLMRLKKLGVKIFLEIPTYPYDDEYREAGSKLRASLWIEKKFRKYFKYFVDRILTYSNDTEIFGVRTLQLDNGVDLASVPLRILPVNRSIFSIIAVSSMEYWHGYDRLILGLRNYYDNKGLVDIKINLVGGIETATAHKYIELVSRLGLDKYVKFSGYVTGEDLDRLFNEADVAVGVVGGHRKSLHSFKSLKNREYCARGIPFVYSGSDSTFDGKSFALQIPEDDTPVDIDEIIQWAASVRPLYRQMRTFAENNISWDIQMKLVRAEYLSLR